MHAGAVILKQRLGHECDGVIVAIGHIFKHIFKPHELIRHLQQGFETHVDFGLSGGGHFMMLGLGLDPQIFQRQDHLGAQILKFIHGRNREITFLVARFVTQVGALVPAGVPVAFDRVDLIKGRKAGGFKADIIKDEKFSFRAEVGHVSDAAAF